MSSLLLVTGPPGAGKSTVAAELARLETPSVLIHGDQFFGFLAEGAIDPWLPESTMQNEVVTEAAAVSTGRFAADRATDYDGVVGPWFLSKFAVATGLAELDYVILLPSVDVCVARVAARVGHGFTDEAATRKMHAEFSESGIDRRVSVIRMIITGKRGLVARISRSECQSHLGTCHPAASLESSHWRS